MVRFMDLRKHQLEALSSTEASQCTVALIWLHRCRWRQQVAVALRAKRGRRRVKWVYRVKCGWATPRARTRGSASAASD